MYPTSATPEQTALRSSLRSFVAEEIVPIALEHDRLRTSPNGICDAFASRVPLATFYPDDSGTRRLVPICIAVEELAYGCAAIASLIMLPIILNGVIVGLLDPSQQGEFRRRINSGPVITSFAASERAAGSDLLQVETRAERDGDVYVLSGRKEYSSNLRHASQVIVVARTAKDPGRSTDGLSWFLVPTDATGVTIGDRWETLGMRSMDLSPLELRGVRVSLDRRLGDEGQGIPLMQESLAQSRTPIAAMAVGIARRARDEVLRYATKRVLYGEKLYKQQDYRFRISEMETDIAAARALTYVSAARFDCGLEHTKEASVAKLFAGQMVMRVAEAAAVMLGSVGYTGQSVVEKLFRDARHSGIVEGTAPTHKEIIFAGLLRRGGY